MNILALLSLFNLTGNVWAIISRVLPVAIVLVKELDDMQGMSGKEKFQRVLSAVKSELDKDGFVINPAYDAAVNFSIELALMISRWGSEEKVESIVPRAKVKPKPRPIVPGRP